MADHSEPAELKVTWRPAFDWRNDGTLTGADLDDAIVNLFEASLALSVGRTELVSDEEQFEFPVLDFLKSMVACVEASNANVVQNFTARGWEFGISVRGHDGDCLELGRFDLLPDGTNAATSWVGCRSERSQVRRELRRLALEVEEHLSVVASDWTRRPEVQDFLSRLR